jgi:hypothetical protein
LKNVIEANKNHESKRLLEWASSHIEQAQKSEFYGKLSISLEGGRITRIVSESSIMAPKLEK